MRLLTITTLFIAIASPAMCEQRPTTADLTWMTGCWRFEAKGRVVEEHWMAPAGGALLGMSRTVVGGKLTEFEFIQIRDLPEGLTYIAKPSNQPEAKFVARPATGNEVVFENPAHDFPQTIRYRLSGDALQARIDGTMNGKPRGFDFPYTRTNCVP
jgi:hypothetical protein